MHDHTPPEQTPPTPNGVPGETAPASNAIGPALAEETKTDPKLIAGLIGGGIAFIVITILIIVFLAADPSRTANIRDMFIIALALANLVIGILLVVLIWQLQSLILLLRNEIRPMLINANQTMNTIRGTTVFVSDNMARPAIKVVSFFSGLMGAASSISGKASRPTRQRRPAGSAGASSPGASSPGTSSPGASSPGAASAGTSNPNAGTSG